MTAVIIIVGFATVFYIVSKNHRRLTEKAV